LKRITWWIRCILVLALGAGIVPLAVTASPARAATLGWYALSTVSSTSTIADATFLDTQTGWAVGSNGGLFVTHDGGHTWTTVVLGISDALTQITFPDPQDGYAIGANVIVSTHNGGQSWSTSYPPVVNNL
jgi:photosystem II stability/assembly factor-like uncharacterized protein